MKPKLWQRVQRMRRALRLLHLDTAPGGAAIGLAAGYYDQAHFISDFRELAGMTPGEYVRARSSVSCGFVPHVLASQA